MTTYYDVRFIVRDGSVSLHSLIPQYGYLVFLICFYWYWYMLIPVFLSSLLCFLHMLNCSWAHTLSYLFMYCSFASIGHADVMWSIFSSKCWHSLHLLSVSVYNIFVARYFVCVTLGLLLQLFHFQFLINIIIDIIPFTPSSSKWYLSFNFSIRTSFYEN